MEDQVNSDQSDHRSCSLHIEDQTSTATSGRRLVATMVDVGFQTVCLLGIWTIGSLVWLATTKNLVPYPSGETPSLLCQVFTYLGVLTILLLAWTVPISLFESSSLRAGPGKCLAELVVVTHSGGQLPFHRALARNSLKWIFPFTIYLPLGLVWFLDSRFLPRNWELYHLALVSSATILFVIIPIIRGRPHRPFYDWVTGAEVRAREEFTPGTQNHELLSAPGQIQTPDRAIAASLDICFQLVLLIALLWIDVHSWKVALVGSRFWWVISALWIGPISLLEASPLQAGPGKWLFQLKVTDSSGNRPGILRACFRNALKLVVLWVLLVMIASIGFLPTVGILLLLCILKAHGTQLMPSKYPNQWWHDYLSGTEVQSSQPGLGSITEPSPTPSAKIE